MDPVEWFWRKISRLVSRSTAVTVSVDNTNGREGQSHVNSLDLFTLSNTLLLSDNSRPCRVGAFW